MLAFAMPSEVTRDEVEAIAALAHLDLAPHEIELFARQLSDILEYANQVQQIDTSGVTPTASVTTGLAHERPDAPGASLDRSEALANGPEAAADAGLFKVPRVLG
jgi:aspartyl-tRNA(Asn)/glutamyl-tRNA(Gln) amidotransferase subunit C